MEAWLRAARGDPGGDSSWIVWKIKYWHGLIIDVVKVACVNNTCFASDCANASVLSSILSAVSEIPQRYFLF